MKDIRLTDEQLEIIDRIRSGKMASKTVATADYSYQLQYNDLRPLHFHPSSKRNFMPSKWEQMKVNKILHGLLSGRIKWSKMNSNIRKKSRFSMYGSVEPLRRGVINIAPMKAKLPGHNKSYNPLK